MYAAHLHEIYQAIGSNDAQLIDFSPLFLQSRESREAEAARVSQLQQLLIQMQAQQAANAQQLQMQQAALMRNQVFSAMSLNQILQRNMRDQNAASEGMPCHLFPYIGAKT